MYSGKIDILGVSLQITKKSDIRPVFMACGLTTALFALCMLIPAFVDYFYQGTSWIVFLESAGICFYFGLSMFFATKTNIKAISIKQAFLFTVLVWLMLVIAGSLPFYIYLFPNNYTNAFFEAMSGLSTTGATVIVGLNDMTPGILLWRSMLNFIGGIGIVAVAVSFFPYFRVGGMQIFQMESSENFGKITPRVADMAKNIALVYLVLFFACSLCLKFAGMNWFDAINHAMPTIATGGFSNKDSSIGYYNNPLYEFILIVFMISGALPLTYYIRLFQKNREKNDQDRQVVTFILVIAFFVICSTIWLFLAKNINFTEALRKSSFNVTSIITDTGFASDDYGLWGNFAITIFFILPFIGGCTGSTAGAIKIFRWQIFFGYLKENIIHLFLPHKVIKMKYGQQSYNADLLISVIIFIALYVVFFVICTFLVSATGVDFLTSSSTVAASMANSGPGLGSIAGPSGNYLSLPLTAKWILSFAMLAGRLELLTILVLFMPEYWKS
ncbi:MAG: TrkH family potassium uptake protein [Alphaproteobacteria bacterium]